MPTLELISQSLADTEALAARLAAALRPGDFVLLTGDLGAGKTTLIRTLATALGVDASAISSPTFVIANEYRAPATRIIHIDAYRLVGDDEELANIGWEKLATPDAIVLIEWADRIDHLIDRPALRIAIEHVGPTARRFTIDIPSGWHDRPECRAFVSFPASGPASPVSRRPPTTCPVTGDPVPPDAPFYPFSSERAQWADLYKWFNESYQLNRPIDHADLEQGQ